MMLSKEWKQELSRCADDRSMCLITFMAPCYQFSLNAEAMDHNCVACCVLYTLAFCMCCHSCMGAYLRTLIREKKGIDGTPLMDAALHCCLPCVALIQEGQEVGVMVKPQEITRQ